MDLPSSDSEGFVTTKLSGHEETLAMQLLHSTDSKIAAAAKRIFSTSFPQHHNDSNDTSSDGENVKNTMNDQVRSINENQFSIELRDAVRNDTYQVVESNGSNRTSVFGSQHQLSNPPNDQSIGDTQSVLVTDHSSTLKNVSFTNNFTFSKTSQPTSQENSHLISIDCKTSKTNENDDKSPTERLKRSRERNRMHARRTRQRKKEHLQNLQNRANELRDEQLRLKQIINEKNTANILLVMCTALENHADKSSGFKLNPVDPAVDALLTRSVDDIPSASKIPELPALVLPSQHHKKRKVSQTDDSKDPLKEAGDESPSEAFPDDGIDYDLLRKDRSLCTPDELDKIRRERNRMHAKRTRDRKRLFMEEMEEMIKQLEGENRLLHKHIDTLNPSKRATSSKCNDPTEENKVENATDDSLDLSQNRTTSPSGVASHQMTTQWANSNDASAVSVSTVPSRSESLCDYDYNENFDSIDSAPNGFKRQRIIPADVPSSITTNVTAAVGC